MHGQMRRPELSRHGCARLVIDHRARGTRVALLRVAAQAAHLFPFVATAGVCLDVLLDVSAVPGPPVSWTMSLSDYSPGREERDLSLIPAGSEFHLEIEAMDAMSNKWGRGAGGRAGACAARRVSGWAGCQAGDPTVSGVGLAAGRAGVQMQARGVEPCI